MHICRREYCNFVIWSEKDGTLVERVPADSDFFENFAGDLQDFFVYGTLPEIVGVWYTRQPVSNKENSVKSTLTDKNDMDYDDNEDYKKTWCYCGQPSYGQMIHCDHESCSIEWFHCDCLRIRKIPKGTWRCPSCWKLPKKAKRQKNLIITMDYLISSTIIKFQL